MDGLGTHQVTKTNQTPIPWIPLIQHSGGGDKLRRREGNSPDHQLSAKYR